jgi:ribosomal protein S18 acetylase RimI-like enzyme
VLSLANENVGRAGDESCATNVAARRAFAGPRKPGQSFAARARDCENSASAGASERRTSGTPVAARIVAQTMSPLTASESPKLATQDAAAELVAMLCSASREIGLKEHVCGPDKQPELLKWMKDQCEARRVWVLSDGAALLGMLILKENVAGILYLVVAESFRGRGLGPALVRHIQSLGAESLSAEARNDRARRMLERCGFRTTEVSLSGHPMLLWQRPDAKPKI